MKVFHGGNLSEASKKFSIPLSEWVDLSTGINPHPYPVGELPQDCWSRLPEQSRLEALKEAACQYYGVVSSHHIVAVSGTQTLLQILPYLFGGNLRVRIVGPTYKEHEHCWGLAGHDVREVPDLATAQEEGHIVILVNPNNPTGEVYTPEVVEKVATEQQKKGGYLIVDGAFMDCTPDYDMSSLVGHPGLPGLIVLRSFGKFFGLAGIRLGFVLAPTELAERLEEGVGPWCVSGPAIEIGIQAFQDQAWVKATRIHLTGAANRLDQMLENAGLSVQGEASLFRYADHRQAHDIYLKLAARGVLVRPFEDQSHALRFGLPHEKDWDRVEDALLSLNL